ncbi:hypothetical protein B0H67DRAFT_640853 [Lasiosphaeris hirsuta]|uniref:Putative gamma-glutamylcyclotransferase n=1 Tax=Lasiosphaeris hirsuta TaxID=260670 RepID=A0AA40AYE8_9PEZI|nr:hypothetical protein B0H67DRAFT_640853 [Lasiosphaeris hirsuta]
MSSLDIMDELEAMEQFAADCDAAPEEADDTAIQRWQGLFGYSYSEAAEKLQGHRFDICRNPTSDAHWSMDRQQKPPARAANEAPTKYLFKMEGPLHRIDEIKAIGCLSAKDAAVLKLIAGTDDSGLPANFCIVDETTKHSIKHRLASDSTLPLPMQDEYPVWYFFYGTLADLAVLRRLLHGGDDNAEPLTYRPARITGGSLNKWGGKYLALVDAGGKSTVEGSGFLVLTKDQEDALRYYETDKYEAVRCKIRMLDDETTVGGLTFRFVP